MWEIPKEWLPAVSWQRELTHSRLTRAPARGAGTGAPGCWRITDVKGTPQPESYVRHRTMRDPGLVGVSQG